MPSSPPSPSSPPAPSSSLREVALLFLRLGVTAFGGPAAHIAMMRDEVVTRRRWLSSAEFLDLLGATNLIPGPNSTEMAIHIGHKRAGVRGLVVAGACFIVPAALVTLALAWGYVRFGAVPEVRGLLYGVKPVIMAVVLQAIASLGKTALRTRSLWALGLACLVASRLGAPELGVLLGAGALVAVLRAARGAPRAPGDGAIAPLAAAAVTTTHAAVAYAPTTLFLVFLKIGSVLFGSGYVLLAFLRAELVVRLGWLTERELIDAVATGQLTPGPVFSTATFLGYVVGGGTGATLATLGIFLPAFLFVGASGWLVPRMRGSTYARAFLDGVNVASLALMASVSFDLGRASFVDAPTIALGVASAALLLRFKVSSAWLVLGGAAAGLLLKGA